MKKMMRQLVTLLLFSDHKLSEKINLEITIAILFLVTSTYPQQIWTPTNGPFGGEFAKVIVKDGLGNLFLGTERGGLWKSTDNGKIWSQKNSGIPYRKINSIAVDTNNAIYIATGRGTIDNGYIIKSTDKGETWFELYTFYSTEAKYITVGSNNWIYVGTAGGGIFISTDYGGSWASYNESLTNLNVNSIFYMDGYIFALTDGGGIFRSPINEIKWTVINNGITPVYSNYIFASNYAIRSDGLIILATNTELYKSSNYGDDWILLSKTSAVEKMVFDSNNVLYAAISVYEPGIKRSFTTGESWENYGLEGLNCYEIIFNDSVFFAGTLLSGLFRKLPGENWAEVFNQGTVPVATEKLLFSDDGRIYAGTQDWGLYFTTDFGDSWIKTGLLNTRVTNIAIAKNGYVFAGEYEVWRSTDNGMNFSQVSDAYSRSIYVDNNDYIWVGSHYSGLIKSTDYGQIWQKQLNSSFTHYGVILQISDSIYINGYYNAYPAPHGPEFTYGSERSIDFGTTWQNIFDGRELLDFKINSQGKVFALHNFQIYTSSDYGISWFPLNFNARSIYINSNGDLFSANFNEVSYSADQGFTWNYLPTEGFGDEVKDLVCYKDTLIFICGSNGVFKRDQKIISLVENELNIVASYVLAQNYPNPFNPRTKISYQLPVNTLVILKVYDLLGREIASLVSEERQAGNYEVEFDASKLSSGIYFYQLRTPNFFQTRKMQILK